MKAEVKFFGTILLAVFALGTLCLAQSNTNSESHLADYVVSGVKIRAGFTPNKNVFVQGEPLEVTFTVQNISSTDFMMDFGGDYRESGRHDRFRITVANSAGQSLADPAIPSRRGGGISQIWPLKSNKIFTNILDLSQFRVFNKPDQYTVDCTFLFDYGFPLSKSTGAVAHSSFKIIIVDRTPDHVAEIIQSGISEKFASSMASSQAQQTSRQ